MLPASSTLPVTHHPRFTELVAYLESRKWRYAGTHPAQPEWWTQAILVFTSTVEPQTARLYLTVLADPQHLEKVWALGLSHEAPPERIYRYPAFIFLNEVGAGLWPVLDPIVSSFRTGHIVYLFDDH